ncbi:MurR/RpiR family transcriptional regulator [Halalkalibacter alkaliphilus]|uniref:MurR/RpiR family transcriptional regulator n=1 Tax=Halalkalibacter alkaliphilus TaxID=2917993 RepID=A0A9X2CRS4_9BACI|nr:MurR/RpiR family transcriptional regulator [Halalkalibacter alkaliphilus]MCL7746865.1 MurR/RpiR family transcriptional regulator [Halalkalibacter alkaliphilus]
MSVESFIVEKIKTSSHNITKSQKLVADFLVKNSDKATYMTANQIGMDVGVSETTVIRFALSLGYKRFSDLQDELRQLIIGDRTVQRLQKANSKVGENSALGLSFQQDIQNLHKTLEQIDETDFNEVVDLIGEANHTFIIGLRSSLADAYYLGFSLNAMLGNVKAITNTGMDLEDCLLKADEGSVVIGFAFTRFTSATVEAMSYLKAEKNCKVITITDSVRCPTIPFSDYLFLTEIESFTPIDSHVASMALSNALISAVGQKQEDKVEENLNTLERYFNKTGVFFEK